MQVEGAQLLRHAQIDTPELDMRLMLEQVLNCSRLDLSLKHSEFLSAENYASLITLLKRRLCFEPMAYLMGHKEFYGLTFVVNKDCLIPRPDTEIVVEHCLRLLKDKKEPVVFDVATGSGAIALTLLKERPDLSVWASDLSAPALKIAQTNAKNLLLTKGLNLLQGDLLEPFKNLVPADVIVSNPPYIGNADFQSLPSDVKNYEPPMALKAGDEHGLIFYRRLLALAPKYLASGGFLVMEIGFNQAQLIADLVGPAWQSFAAFPDLAGHLRVVVLQKA